MEGGGGGGALALLRPPFTLYFPLALPTPPTFVSKTRIIRTYLHLSEPGRTKGKGKGCGEKKEEGGKGNRDGRKDVLNKELK